MTRPHNAHFTALHVAAEARKDARSGDHDFRLTERDRFVTGGNLDFNVPVQQPCERSTSGGVDLGALPSGQSQPLYVRTDGSGSSRPAKLPDGSRAAQSPGITGASLTHSLIGLCRSAGLPEPIPEYVFHPTRRWKFDYAFRDHMIAVEIEGGIWRRGGGAHSHPLNIERDIEKYNAAAMWGWRVLRYAPENLMNALPDLREILRIA